MIPAPQTVQASTPWNKGQFIGQKPPLKLQEIWAIRIRLQLQKEPRELALFNLAIDSKLRSCDLERLQIMRKLRGLRKEGMSSGVLGSMLEPTNTPFNYIST